MRITENKVVMGLLVAMSAFVAVDSGSAAVEPVVVQESSQVASVAVISREQIVENQPSRTRPTKAMVLAKFKNAKKLSDKELVSLLRAVGFKGENLKEAYGIAKKESTGRPLAYNGNKSTGDKSYGIFQINMIGDLGPARREKFNLNSNKDLFDPVTNAQIAFYMSQGGKDWSSWHGYTDKAKKLANKYF